MQTIGISPEPTKWDELSEMDEFYCIFQTCQKHLVDPGGIRHLYLAIIYWTFC